MTRVSTVRFPIVLRTDSTTAGGGGAALLEAFDRGLDRGIGRARDALQNEADAPPAGLHLGDITIRWSGSGCDRVAADARWRLEQSLRERIAEALPGRRRPGSRDVGFGGNGGRGAGERESLDRWTDTGDYLIPSYDDWGGEVPVTVEPQALPAPSSYEDVLYPFNTYEEVLQKILEFFPNPAPRGGRYYGVYGYWVPLGQPTLFWLKESPSFLRTQGFVTVQVRDGQIIPSNHPIGYEAGRIYRLRVLSKPKQHKGIEYWLERTRLDGSRPNPAFLNHLLDELRGWEIHFGAAVIRQENIFITGEATTPDPGIPPWVFFLVSFLGWQPDNGVSDGAWWYIGWLNIVPFEVRQDPIVKEIVEEWATSKPSLNILFLYLHANEFYRAYCFRLALRMLEESRRHLEDFLRLLQQEPNHPWADKFDTVVRFLAPTGLQAAHMETGLEGRYDRVLGSLRDLAEYRERLYQQQEESVAAGRGGLPGGIIRLDELQAIRAEIDRIEAERLRAPTELPKARATIGAGEALEPLLVVLTLRNGKEITNIPGALARYAPQIPPTQAQAEMYQASGTGQYEPWRTTERPSEWVRREFAALIETSREAERNMRDNPDKVYQIGIVRQAADARLKPWLDANPFYAESIKKMIAGLGLLDWLLIAVALIAITLACPPLGLSLSAGIGGLQLASSVGRYSRFRVYSRARLAQHGFVPLVSKSEVDAAFTAVVLDTVFLFLDLKGLVSMARASARTAARGARGALGAFDDGIDRLLASVRHTEAWPETLNAGIRQQVEELAKREGALAGRSVDEVVELAKAEMAVRYERHLLGVKDELGRLLEKPGLTGDELQQWLTQRLGHPTEFLDTLAKELKEGTELWESVAAKARAGTASRALGAGFEFLPTMSDEAARALKAELGALADTLTPERLLRLGLDLKIPYPDLARRLNTLLGRTPDAAKSLQLLEDICRGRPDADAILRALETQARPAVLLEHLTPTLLDGVPGMSVQQLFEAMSRTTEAGVIERFYVHTRVGGDVALARDIVKDGRLMIQRWGGPERGWQIYRQWGPRPLGDVGAAARRAAEASTLASVVEGNARASRGLARLSERGRATLLEELEDTTLDPALARRILEDIDSLPDASLDALVAIKKADQVSGGLVASTWVDVLEHSRGWRDELLRLVGELHDVVDAGLSEAIRRGMSGATNIQGSLGHLHAAVTLRRRFPNARMSFEVETASREIDIVLHDGARRIDIEVKTNLGSELSINRWQMQKDLRRHAADRGQDLLYLYHPDAATRLADVKTALMEEARAVLDQAGAQEVARRIDQIVQIYQLH